MQLAIYLALVASLIPLSLAAATRTIVSAWFSDWVNTDLSTVNWSQYTELDFFVGVTGPLPNAITFTGLDDEPTYMRKFTATARQNGVKSSLCIGGWTGSAYFSSLVGTASSRDQFAAVIQTTLQTYGFDGVSIDWEYPGLQGQDGNQISPNDTANFLEFIKVLRGKLGTATKISAAVSMTGFVDANGWPLVDASGFAAYFDYIAIMAYDVAGSWNVQTGNLAPLSAACAPAQQAVSVETAFKYWTGAGFPANKLVLGIPSYGYEFQLLSNTLKITKGANNRVSKAYQDKTDYFASYKYSDLVNMGVLTQTGYGKNGWTTYWDSCASTPFAVNTASKRFLAYDNPQSITAKAQWANKRRMGGVKMFDWVGDSAGVLIKAAKKGFTPMLTRQAAPVLTRPKVVSAKDL